MEDTNKGQVRNSLHSNKRKKDQATRAPVSISILNQKGECLLSTSLFIGLITLIISSYIYIGNQFEVKTKSYLQEFQNEWQKLQIKYPPTSKNHSAHSDI